MTRKRFASFLLCCCIVIACAEAAFSQRRDPSPNGRSGGKTLYGDVSIEGEQLSNGKPVKVDLTLYTESRTVVERSTVSGNGRYRFNNIPEGMYELVAEVEDREISRVRVDMRSPLVGEFKQDLALTWTTNGPASSKSSVVSAADYYKRSSANAELFKKAGGAIDKKDFDNAEQMLKKLVTSDSKDFQAWTELGNVHLLKGNYAAAENDYLHAIDLHTNYFPALLNLGRAEVALKNFDMAADVLKRAVEVQPASADANYLLGESYLQLQKGSAAVGYLNEALKLDPKGMAEVRLRLALLYNAAGMKEKAAAEYEEFLKARPDYPDRKQLEEFISNNKKP